MKSIMLDSTLTSCSTKFCYPAQASRVARKSWLKGQTVMLATLNTGEQRHVVAVKFYTSNKFRTGLMDCVTGTIYRNGRCLSSDRLEIVSVDERDHKESLLGKPPVEWRAKQW